MELMDETLLTLARELSVWIVQATSLPQVCFRNSYFARTQDFVLTRTSCQLPDDVWYSILSQMLPKKDLAKLCCVSHGLTVKGSAWEHLRSVLIWSSKVKTLWFDITQIKQNIDDHRILSWNIDCNPIKTDSDLYHYYDMQRETAFREGKIIRSLKQSFTQHYQQLESLLSQYPQFQQHLVAFNIDVEDVRKAFLASGSECGYEYV